MGPVRRNRGYNIFDDFNSMLNETGKYNMQYRETRMHPALNILNNKENYEINIDLPGMEKKDIDISISEDVLTISGERKQISTEKDDKLIRNEVRHGKFNRSFSLSDDVNPDDISAHFKNGVLTLKLKKNEPIAPKTNRNQVRYAPPQEPGYFPGFFLC